MSLSHTLSQCPTAFKMQFAGQSKACNLNKERDYNNYSLLSYNQEHFLGPLHVLLNLLTLFFSLNSLLYPNFRHHITHLTLSVPGGAKRKPERTPDGRGRSSMQLRSGHSTPGHVTTAAAMILRANPLLEFCALKAFFMQTAKGSR